MQSWNNADRDEFYLFRVLFLFFLFHFKKLVMYTKGGNGTRPGFRELIHTVFKKIFPVLAWVGFYGLNLIRCHSLQMHLHVTKISKKFSGIHCIAFCGKYYVITGEISNHK